MASALYRKLSTAAAAHARSASTAAGRKVCVIGAAGGIGQPLSLLLKMVRLLAMRQCASVASWGSLLTATFRL
jgi:NADPH:quinone reductase-like Zn-dependent oxidoreductase